MKHKQKQGDHSPSAFLGLGWHFIAMQIKPMAGGKPAIFWGESIGSIFNRNRRAERGLSANLQAICRNIDRRAAAGADYCLSPLRYLTRTVVWIVRGTPLMLQLLIIYYVPGMVLESGTPWIGDGGRFTASAVAFIFNYACYFSEIYRGGIQGVPVGQQEAGQVLGMTKSQIFFKVTLLQMVKRIIPPMSNEVITLVKDTSLARIISWQELIFAGYSFLKGSHGYAGLLWPLFFTAVYYLAFSGVLTLLFGWVEKKLGYFKV